ncbi:hypothetical protein B0I37DRAFT_379934 [Chaetomium sp. MPI-CAGE-AT-0009]|nr:hypothetical protein B0I37DRAFT_379934 [Chaetomium sp. MPI-CAGE-AT-0009]
MFLIVRLPLSSRPIQGNYGQTTGWSMGVRTGGDARLWSSIRSEMVPTLPFSFLEILLNSDRDATIIKSSSTSHFRLCWHKSLGNYTDIMSSRNKTSQSSGHPLQKHDLSEHGIECRDFAVNARPSARPAVTHAPPAPHSSSPSSGRPSPSFTESSTATSAARPPTRNPGKTGPPTPAPSSRRPNLGVVTSLGHVAWDKLEEGESA